MIEENYVLIVFYSLEHLLIAYILSQIYCERDDENGKANKKQGADVFLHTKDILNERYFKYDRKSQKIMRA